MGINDVTRLFVIVVVIFSAEGYEFHVGGRDGWVVKPAEEYNHWAERTRFQVNDTLLFKYEKGEDSVLVVTRDNYVHCYTKAPIQNLIEGDAEFKFERSGPFYFISGNEENCKQGQRLIVVVLAVRPRKTPPLPSPAQPAPTPEAAASEAPAQAPKGNFAGRSVAGGSVGLVTLCLGVVGATLLMNS